MAYEIYEVRDITRPRLRLKRYAIIRSYDSKFLEWCDLERIDYEDAEINEQLECDGSVVVSRREAELIMKQLNRLEVI